jgi:integrase
MTAKRESGEAKEVYQSMIKAQVQPETSRKIANAICQFIEFRKLKGETLTAFDLLTEAKTNFENTKQELRNYFLWLKGETVEGYPTNEKVMLESSAKERVYSKCVSFYSHQDIRFPKGFTPKISSESKAIKADLDHPFLVLNKEETDTVIDKTELKAFLNSLTPRDRAIGLCMLSSSQDSGDILKLTVGEFRAGCKQNHTGIRFFFTNERNKTSVRFQTFFSTEATEAVFQYLRTERIGALDSEPLFTNTKGNAVTHTNLSENFAYGAKSIGIVWGTENQNPFRPKRLRHFFLTCAAKAGLGGTQFEKQFTGHILTVGERYNENRADLEVMFKRIEPYLLIFTGSDLLEKTVKTLSDTEDTIKELKETISDVRFQRDQIKDQLDENKAKMVGLEKSVDIMKEEFDKAYAEFREERDRMRKANEQKDQKDA